MGTRRSAGSAGWTALLALPVIGLVAGACFTAGAAGAATTGSGRVDASAAAASTTSSGGQRVAPGTSPYYEVKTGTVPGLGTVLVNGQGLTLYMFVPDRRRGESTCYKACASAWPPLRLPTGVTVPVAGGKAVASLLGTTTREDGGQQVTYDGWPLYLWVVDTAPGQATGQGLNSLGGLWYVLSPKGKVIKTKVAKK
jgi:predicted lipoprotein with Yx(FWY)xxD motif